jgi:uncharacterized membrane protein
MTSFPFDIRPAAPAASPDPAHGSDTEISSTQRVADSVIEAAEFGTHPQTDRRTRRASNRAFRAVKAQHAADRTFIESLADRLTTFASSSPFLLLHAAWFLVWIPWNMGLIPGLRAFDPFPFGLLTMWVSLEAIFLSIFVLMAQNRESAIAELREEVNLQVTLRLEEEVTKTLQLVAGLYTRLGHRMGEDAELQEMLQPLDPLSIEQDLIQQIRDCRPSRSSKREK